MSTDLDAYFASLARYHVWATDRLLEAIAALEDDAYRCDAGLFFRSVHGTLNHLLVAENLWYTRFAEGVSPVVKLDAELHADRELLARALREAASRWMPFVTAIAPDRLAGTIAYRTMRGSDVVLPYAPTLGHVFNHGTHHRGQVTAAITRLGAQSPELDWVYLLQQE